MTLDIAQGAAATRPRVAFYSHDTMGLGHVRRNLLLADAIRKGMKSELDVLVITGAREARLLDLSPGIDFLTLPALRKQIDGSYEPRNLGVGIDALIRLRSGLIRTALRSFSPDLFVVDNVPRGAMGELMESLEEFSGAARSPRCVLGLRDIADDPGAVQREWHEAHNAEAIARHFDEIWVYGDRNVYDRLRSDDLPGALIRRARYTGYLDQTRRAEALTRDPQSWLRANLPALASSRSFALCLVGGGEDGGRIASAFARASFGEGRDGVLVSGPFLPDEMRAELREFARGRPDLHLIDAQVEVAALVAAADRIVCMGGYNSLGEVMSYQKHALVVPRTEPRREQEIRALRFLDLGIVDAVLMPRALSTDALSRWLVDSKPKPSDVRKHIDLDGLDRVAAFAREHLERSKRFVGVGKGGA